jgi:hypothetical protein
MCNINAGLRKITPLACQAQWIMASKGPFSNDCGGWPQRVESEAAKASSYERFHGSHSVWSGADGPYLSFLLIIFHRSIDR